MTLSTPKRIGLGAAVLAVCATLWWWWRAPAGFLTGMVPIDADRALFTMRHNPSDGDARAWLGLLDANGEVAWSNELPALTYSVYAGHGITVSSDLVTIKVSDQRTYAQILAFDLETGEVRWQSPRVEFSDPEGSFMQPVVPGERPYTDGKRVIVGDTQGDRELLVARAAYDGTRSWEHEVDGGMRDLMFAAETLAYRAEMAWTFVSLETGAVVQRVKAYAAGCGDAERFVTWHRDQLITVDWSRPDFTVTRQALPSQGIPLYCGLREGMPVFTVENPYNEIAERRFELIAVEPDTASVAWRINLGTWEPSSIARSRDNDTNEAHPLRGTLTDFVPVLLGTHGSDGVKLIMLDMTTHEIAWEGLPHPRLLHFDLFRGHDAQYFLTDAGRVAALDGNTGTMTAAIEVGHQDARALHAAHGQLWLFSMGWEHMNALPWMRLDGTTLKLLAAGNDKFRPRIITGEFAKWIGAQD